MMARKTLGAAIAALAITLGVTPACAGPAITVLTGGTEGVYYPLGVSIAMIYADIPGAKVDVQTTDGSVENLTRLQRGTGQVAFALGDALRDAWAGDTKAGFQGRLDKLRVIGALYPNYVQIAALKSSGIRRLEDIRGKSLSVGEHQSGTELNARTILGAARMSYRDLAAVQYVPFDKSTELMQKKQLDAALQSAGLGVVSLKELSEASDIALVPIPAALVRKIGPPFKPAVIPARTYLGQDEPVPTASVMNYLVTSKDIPDDLAYQMTKRLFDSLPELAIAHRAGREITLAGAVSQSPVPLHPGALRYYRERGLIR